MPKATRRRKGPGAKSARSPRTPKIANNSTIETAPMNPNSSAMLAKMKSCGSAGKKASAPLHVALPVTRRSHGDQRLVDVEAGALRVGLRRQEDQHALPPPGTRNSKAANGAA